MNVKKYVRKNLAVVEAMQAEPKNKEVLAFAGDVIKPFGDGYVMRGVTGTMKIESGDYIVKDSDGNCYPCSKGYFEDNYELADKTKAKKKKSEK